MANFTLSILIKAFDSASGVFNKVSGALNKTVSGFAAAGHRMSAIGGSMQAVGKSMIGAGAAFAAPGIAGAFAIKKLVDAAAEYSGALAHVRTAMVGDTNIQAELNELQEKSEKLALNGVIGTKQLAEAYYIARSQGLGHADALAAIAAGNNLVTGATENAEAAQAAMAETMRTLTGLHNIYGVSVNRLADSLALLQTKYAFKDITEVTDALKYVASSAAAAHVPLPALTADIALLSQNMKIGGQAGETLEQLLIQFEKGGSRGLLRQFQVIDKFGHLDLNASIAKMQAALAKLSSADQGTFLTKAGFQSRGLAGIQILLANIAKAKAIETDYYNSTGAAAAAATTRKGGADEQMAIFRNSLSVLAETLGTALLPTATAGINSLTASIGDMVTWTTAHMPEIQSVVKGVGATISDVALRLKGIIIEVVKFGEAHPALAKLALQFALIGPIISLVGGAAMIAGGGFLFLGGGILRVVGGILQAPKRILDFADSLKELSVGIFSAAKYMITSIPAILSFSAALATNPLTWIVLGVAAVALLAYEIYKHWGPIKAFVINLWTGIKAYLTGILPEAAAWGSELIKAITRGIWAVAALPGKAVEWVVGKIRDLLPHSPAKEGPLADLNRVRIVETIAESIHAAPLIDSLSTVAAAVRTAMPTLAWPIGFQPTRTPSNVLEIPRIAARLLSLPSAESPAPLPLSTSIAREAHPAAGSAMHTNNAAISITLNYAPTLTGNMPANFDPKQHAKEITQMVLKEIKRQRELSLTHGG